MKATSARLERRYHTPKVQTRGKLILLNGLYRIDTFPVLELSWQNNQRNISCIAAGKYLLVPHYSPKFGNCLWVQTEDGYTTLPGGRQEVLIHAGNFYTQIRGCILPGTDFRDINSDGHLDVVNSRIAMRDIVKKVKEPISFEITWRTQYV